MPLTSLSSLSLYLLIFLKYHLPLTAPICTCLKCSDDFLLFPFATLSTLSLSYYGFSYDFYAVFTIQFLYAFEFCLINRSVNFLMPDIRKYLLYLHLLIICGLSSSAQKHSRAFRSAHVISSQHLSLTTSSAYLPSPFFRSFGVHAFSIPASTRYFSNILVTIFIDSGFPSLDKNIRS